MLLVFANFYVLTPFSLQCAETGTLAIAVMVAANVHSVYLFPTRAICRGGDPTVPGTELWRTTDDHGHGWIGMLAGAAASPSGIWDVTAIRAAGGDEEGVPGDAGAVRKEACVLKRVANSDAAK